MCVVLCWEFFIDHISSANAFPMRPYTVNQTAGDGFVRERRMWSAGVDVQQWFKSSVDE